MKYDVVPDQRIPERLFWVVELSEKNRTKRLAGYPTRFRAEQDKREREQDEAKRQRAAQRRAV